jgi:signal transduction histidine kinase
VQNSELHVSVDDGKIVMKISDDGTPNMLEGKEIGATIALASMQHRLRVIGGIVDLERTPGGMTVLTASMPLPAEPTIDLK